ncbi:hypothetical protein BHE74_00053402 [Ensete ventricosum]|nr:hypothetical protein BHE74_00053402 [Ensete ventricosum]
MPYWFFWTNRNEAKHSNHSTRLSILAIRALIAANDFINMPPSFKGIVKEVRDVPEEVPLLFSKQMVDSTRTARYRAVPPKIDHRQSISTVDGRLREKSTIGSRLREKSTVGVD